MTKEVIIQKTVRTLKSLPAEKAEEISDFAEYVFKKHEENMLKNGIESLIEQSQAFQFLNDEEDLYSVEDIKEKH
ncbi:hypothetical protein [Mucilaginibacter gotjawali]|uniref:Uncharacterized protein n=2 Tax=Mucilaginibacter gotjawali TaxID=1550579 RepID=A0A839SHX2_9SPHI|nr:hypothetical protein [Mucilaginibacter gotjawali]MBB3056189.1 hypothetical protein [Mucilaginibacter gotjawali]BAU53469.1 hypothetical protein MgSA37_01637 [Mucilaginibacter gotjawali]